MQNRIDRDNFISDRTMRESNDYTMLKQNSNRRSLGKGMTKIGSMKSGGVTLEPPTNSRKGPTI
jgi:hypothetical protein